MIRQFFSALKILTKSLTVLFVGIAILFYASPAAFANPTTQATALDSNTLIALAASSRFAAQSDSEEQSRISEKRLQELRERRRAWQNQASATAAEEAEDEYANSLGEAVRDKLNLDEITEENEVVQ